MGTTARKDFLASVPETGGRLKQAREKAGLTQAQAGRLTGVGRDSVRGYEDESRTIPAEYVRKVAEAAGWSAHWLLTGTGPRQPVDEGAAAAKLEAIRRILSEPDLPPVTPPVDSED